MSACISEVKYSTEESDFIEVAAPAGTDTSAYSIYIYRADGSVESGPLSLGSVQSTTAGKDVYVVNPGEETLGDNDAIALVDETGTVLQFISFNSNTISATEGPASGDTSTDVGGSTGSTTLQSNDGGASYTPAPQSRGTVPCYAPGTLIDTPDGPRAVETLRPGDLVSTVDRGAQPIRWMRSGDHVLDGMEVADKPMLIQAGALGAGRPAQDLIVSPQHRILVGGAGQLTQYFDAEVFAPAKSLTRLPGVRHMKGKTQITWVHFACDRHEVVTANGCLSESLLLGPMVLNGMTGAERRALRTLFRTPAASDIMLNGPPARGITTCGQVRGLLAAHPERKGQRQAQNIRKWDVDAAMERYEAERLRDAAWSRGHGVQARASS